jgi:exodeoxyribonuclease VIII
MDYFALPHVSNSKLTTLKRSPEMYKLEYIDHAIEREETESMKLGSLVHCLILEPSQSQHRYYVAAKIDRRTKEGKAAAVQQEIDAAGKIVIDMEFYRKACKVADAVFANEQVGPVLLSSLGESEAFLSFKWSGMECKSKIDWLAICGDLIIDIKTSQNASPESFAKSVVDYGYHRQAAFYSEAVYQNQGVMPRFIFAVVSTTEPYLCGCYELDNNALDIGRIEIEALVNELKQRTESNDWSSGFTKGINILQLPKWYA